MKRKISVRKHVRRTKNGFVPVRQHSKRIKNRKNNYGSIWSDEEESWALRNLGNERLSKSDRDKAFAILRDNPLYKDLLVEERNPLFRYKGKRAIPKRREYKEFWPKKDFEPEPERKKLKVSFGGEEFIAPVLTSKPKEPEPEKLKMKIDGEEFIIPSLTSRPEPERETKIFEPEKVVDDVQQLQSEDLKKELKKLEKISRYIDFYPRRLPDNKGVIIVRAHRRSRTKN